MLSCRPCCLTFWTILQQVCLMPFTFAIVPGAYTIIWTMWNLFIFLLLVLQRNNNQSILSPGSCSQHHLTANEFLLNLLYIISERIGQNLQSKQETALMDSSSSCHSGFVRPVYVTWVDFEEGERRSLLSCWHN